MSVELKVPAVGESITVVIGEWLKAEGDWVQEDEIVVVVESDKVNLEVPSPVEGQLKRVALTSGTTAAIGDLLAEITPGAAPAVDSGAEQAPVETSAPSQSETVDERVMPAAQRLLATNNLKASDVKATGPGGRLLKEDVERHLSSSGKAASPKSKAAPTPIAASRPLGERSETRTSMTPPKDRREKARGGSTDRSIVNDVQRGRYE